MHLNGLDIIITKAIGQMVYYISELPDECRSKCCARFYAIKDGTTVIANHAFYDCENLTSVTMPKSVTGIGETAFLDVNVNFVTNCYYGSYAYQYALENDIKYKFISNEGMEKFNTNETKTVTISYIRIKNILCLPRL